MTISDYHLVLKYIVIADSGFRKTWGGKASGRNADKQVGAVCSVSNDTKKLTASPGDVLK